MKVIATLFLIVLGAIQQPGTATLEGSFKRQGTSEGIPGVNVLLIGLNPGLPQTPNANQAAQSVAAALQNETAASPAFIEGFLFGTASRFGVSPDLLRPLSSTLVKTDSEGAFKFDGVSPGRYILTAGKDGYLAPRRLGNPGGPISQIITIEAANRPAKLDFFLVRGGVIAGHVRDPLGKPAVNMTITTYETSYPGGKVAWASRMTATTDDRGEFRLSSIPPGNYFVGVVPKTPGTVSSAQDSWQMTFYPGVIAPESALAVTVNGDEITGINVDIRSSNSPTYKISGTATHPISSVQPNANAGTADPSITEFYLVSREPTVLDYGFPVSMRNAIPAGARPNGEFEIQHVKPGTYDLYPAYLDFNVPGYVTSRTTVTVRDVDIAGLSLTTSPGATLEAVVLTEGVFNPPITLGSLHLNFRGLDSTPTIFVGARSDIQFDASGRIKRQSLTEARYQFWLTGLPEMAYISDIREGGKSVYDEGVILDQELKPVQILINSSGSAVSGFVQTSDRKSASNATVLLIPPVSRRGNSRLFRTAVTGDDGKFSITGIMPGSYTILALQDHPSGEPWLNPDFLIKYQDKVRPLTLNPGSTATVQLDLIF